MISVITFDEITEKLCEIMRNSFGELDFSVDESTNFH